MKPYTINFLFDLIFSVSCIKVDKYIFAIKIKLYLFIFHTQSFAQEWFSSLMEKAVTAMLRKILMAQSRFLYIMSQNQISTAGGTTWVNMSTFINIHLNFRSHFQFMLLIWQIRHYYFVIKWTTGAGTQRKGIEMEWYVSDILHPHVLPLLWQLPTPMYSLSTR